VGDGEDAGEESAVASADVHNGLEAREVVRGRGGDGNVLRPVRHRLVEERRKLGVGADTGERVVGTGLLSERRLARLDAVKQIGPPVLRRAAEQPCGGAHRTGHAIAQAGADRREREAPVGFFR